MTNQITRRTALAGAAALPLLPVSASAQSADPVLAAYQKWLAVRADYEQVLKNYSALERQHGVASAGADEYHGAAVDRETDRILDLEAEIADMVPVTVAGMVAQLRVMAYNGGHLGAMDHAVESRFVRSLLAAAESIAEVSIA